MGCTTVSAIELKSDFDDVLEQASQQPGQKSSRQASQSSDGSSEDFISSDDINYINDELDDIEYLDDTSFQSIDSGENWAEPVYSKDSRKTGNAGQSGQAGNVWTSSSSIFGNSEANLSVGEVLDQDAIAQEWSEIQKDIQGVGAAVRSAVKSQVAGEKSTVGGTLFGNGDEFNHQQKADISGGSTRTARNSATSATGYNNEGKVPLFYQWFYKIIKFKNDSPLIFYSVMAVALFILILQSAVIGAMRRHRPVA